MRKILGIIPNKIIQVNFFTGKVMYIKLQAQVDFSTLIYFFFKFHFIKLERFNSKLIVVFKYNTSNY